MWLFMLKHHDLQNLQKLNFCRILVQMKVEIIPNFQFYVNFLLFLCCINVAKRYFPTTKIVVLSESHNFVILAIVQ